MLDSASACIAAVRLLNLKCLAPALEKRFLEREAILIRYDQFMYTRCAGTQKSLFLWIPMILCGVWGVESL